MSESQIPLSSSVSIVWKALDQLFWVKTGEWKRYGYICAWSEFQVIYKFCQADASGPHFQRNRTHKTSCKGTSPLKQHFCLAKTYRSSWFIFCIASIVQTTHFWHKKIGWRSNTNCYCNASVEDSGLLRCDTVWLGQWISTFRRHVMPSSLMFGESKKVKVLGSFETSGRTRPTAWPQIPAELNPQYRGCGNVVSCVMRAGVVFCIPKCLCPTYNLQTGYVSVPICIIYCNVYFRAA